MSVHVFASATHDFYFKNVNLPQALHPLLNTDGQGILYLSMPQETFFDALRQQQVVPELSNLTIDAAAFLPLADAKFTDGFSTGKGANPAAMCAMLGLKSTMYCALGTDSYSQQCVRELTRLGVTVLAQIFTGMTMAHAHIFIQDPAHQLSLIYKGTNNLASHTLVPDDALNDDTTLLINTSVPLDETRQLLKRAQKRGVKRIVFNCVKPAELTQDDFSAVSHTVLNRDEAHALVKHFNFSYDEEDDQTLATVLADKLGVKCIMTRGSQSVVIAHDGNVDEVFPNRINVIDVTGAGDGFLGVCVAGIDRDKDIVQTVKEATVAGGLIAAHHGPRRCDITQALLDIQSGAIMASPVNTGRINFRPRRAQL
jgi:ribokinase